MNRKILVSILVFGVLFCTLFVLRLMYDFQTRTAETPQQLLTVNADGRQESMLYGVKRNIATKQYRENATVVDQKYEKIATLTSQSRQFEDDESKIRSSIDSYNALIQYENLSGLSGYRHLVLIIGVPPRSFDAMVDDIKQVGRLMSLSVVKSDKTNEYRELNAQLDTLRKTHASLGTLKQHNASVDELIQLENRLLELEKEIQDLGVSLGEFDEENEFCTVHLTIEETGTSTSTPLTSRIYHAFVWSVKTMLTLSLGFFLVMLAVFLAVTVIQKLGIDRWFTEMFGK